MQELRVGIIGGGFAGLACAHYLLKAGHRPVVLEAGESLGTESAPAEVAGVQVEPLYAPIGAADSALCGLLADVGMLGQVVWQPTRSAVMIDRQLFGVDATRDLFRLSALGPLQRLRSMLATTYATRTRLYALDLDDVPAVDWLRSLYGAQVWERVWRPFLRSRFADYADEVSAYWVWRVINQHARARREVCGHVRGGFPALAEHLGKSIERRGGEVHRGVSIDCIDVERDRARVEVGDRELGFDAVISTLPLADVAKLAVGSVAEELTKPQLVYQGVVNVVVVSRTRLSGFYSTAVLDGDFGFHRIAEPTHVIPPGETGGRHLIHLSHYCGSHTTAYHLPDDVLSRLAVESLGAVDPRFRPGQVEGVHVFRTPRVEPLWMQGALRQRPDSRVGELPVYLCSTDQAYPRLPGRDTSVALARETVGRLILELGSPCQAEAEV